MIVSILPIDAGDGNDDICTKPNIYITHACIVEFNYILHQCSVHIKLMYQQVIIWDEQIAHTQCIVLVQFPFGSITITSSIMSKIENILHLFVLSPKRPFYHHVSSNIIWTIRSHWNDYV